MRSTSLAGAAVLIATVAGKAGLLASVSLAPAPGASASAPQDLPDGPGKDVVARLCSGCHDLMFTVSTRETEEGWTRVVNDMRSRGLDGTEEEFAQAIEYLTIHMGKAEVPTAHMNLEILANRTKVAPGERFALGLRLVPTPGWHLKSNATAGQSPQISWTAPRGIAIGDPIKPIAEAALTVFPATVSADAASGSTLDLTVRVAYEVCRETCTTETATTSLKLPVGSDGIAINEDEFARARVAPSR